MIIIIQSIEAKVLVVTILSPKVWLISGQNSQIFDVQKTQHSWHLICHILFLEIYQPILEQGKCSITVLVITQHGYDPFKWCSIVHV